MAGHNPSFPVIATGWKKYTQVKGGHQLEHWYRVGGDGTRYLVTHDAVNGQWSTEIQPASLFTSAAAARDWLDHVVLPCRKGAEAEHGA